MKRALIFVILLLTLTGCAQLNEEPEVADAIAPAETVEVVETIVINTHEELLYCDDTMQLKATVNPAGEKMIAWSSSDSAIATVNDDGIVTGISGGNVTITAALVEKPSVSASTEITVGLHVSSVSLPQAQLTLLLGTNKADAVLAYQVIPQDAFCQDVSISSSDENIVTVDTDGSLHAVGSGTAVVTVKSLDEACTETTSCEVTVQQGVSSIVLSEEQAVFYWGDTLNLIAEILPEDADNPAVVWSSSDESIATVSVDGEINPVGTGTVDIICTAQDGGESFGKCTVDVVIGVESLKIQAENRTLLIGAADELCQL